MFAIMAYGEALLEVEPKDISKDGSGCSSSQSPFFVEQQVRVDPSI
jgi:hypothetical protein